MPCSVHRTKQPRTFCHLQPESKSISYHVPLADLPRATNSSAFCIFRVLWKNFSSIRNFSPRLVWTIRSSPDYSVTFRNFGFSITSTIGLKAFSVQRPCSQTLALLFLSSFLDKRVSTCSRIMVASSFTFGSASCDNCLSRS